VEKKILVLGVDRDNDIGDKTGINGPILGKKALMDTALALGVKDPTESDTNVLFHCIKLYDQLEAEGREVYVACVTGDKQVGVTSDMVISEQLDTIISLYDTRNTILVTDGREDENILPILQSKLSLVSIERVTVQQSESLEDTYFILHRYLKRMMEDRKVSGLLLGLPGIIILIYAFTYLFPEFTKYGWFSTFSIVGIYLFAKGFGVDDYVRERITPRKIKLIAYSVALVIAAYGAYNGFQNIKWGMVPYLNWESVRYVFTVFFDGSFPLLYIGILAALAGNVISAYTRGFNYIWNHLIVFILACGIFGTIYQYTSFTQNEITRNEMVFSLLVIGFLSVMGIGVSLIQRSKIKRETSKQRRLPIGGRGILTLFIGIFVITALTVYALDETAIEPTGDLTFPVTRSLADQDNPVMGEMEGAGAFFLWEDNRDGNWDIFIKYLDSSDEVNLSDNPNDQRHPRTWQGKVVWEDNRNGNWDIYLYDIESGATSRITNDPFNQTNPDIYGSVIVWEDDRHGNSDIYMYDIEDGKEERITMDDPELQPFQTSPRIYDDTIIWLDNRFGEFNIFSYDIATGNESTITSGRSIKFNPSIHGDTVVWEDNRNGNWDIFRYNLTTNVQTQVTSSPTNQINPSVYGQYIVWEDDRNGNKDIYLNDIESGTIRQVTTSVLDQERPEVYATYIVWVDWRNDLDGMQTGTAEDNPDIYATNIDDLSTQ